MGEIHQLEGREGGGKWPAERVGLNWTDVSAERSWDVPRGCGENSTCGGGNDSLEAGWGEVLSGLQL